MKAPMDKHYDDLAKKIITSVDLDKTSPSFTDNLMSKIEALPLKSSLTYKPLISKPMLYLIGIGFVAFIIFMVQSSETTSLGWLDGFDMSFLSEFSMGDMFEEITISKTAMYSVVLFGAMLWVQIGLLKRRHDSQFSV
ncbi:hypothetical protein [Winogradskyella sp. 3972H.M.0a.05]|uniref:hypothetical protein n=1 Tax=Winogradskyella sp. 3972H.M.0a.05 TaxID=2950277 RepID=UPI0033938F7C